MEKNTNNEDIEIISGDVVADDDMDFDSPEEVDIPKKEKKADEIDIFDEHVGDDFDIFDDDDDYKVSLDKSRKATEIKNNKLLELIKLYFVNDTKISMKEIKERLNIGKGNATNLITYMLNKKIISKTKKEGIYSLDISAIEESKEKIEPTVEELENTIVALNAKLGHPTPVHTQPGYIKKNNQKSPYQRLYNPVTEIYTHPWNMSDVFEAAREHGLRFRQELFCRYYASPNSDMGNGVQCYIKAYNKDPSIPGVYEACKQKSYIALGKLNIIKRISQLLEGSEAGLNDANADRNLAFMMSQKADLNVALQAIKHYDKRKGRVQDKLDKELSAPFGAINITVVQPEDIKKDKEEKVDYEQ